MLVCRNGEAQIANSGLMQLCISGETLIAISTLRIAQNGVLGCMVWGVGCGVLGVV